MLTFEKNIIWVIFIQTRTNSRVISLSKAESVQHKTQASDGNKFRDTEGNYSITPEQKYDYAIDEFVSFISSNEC